MKKLFLLFALCAFTLTACDNDSNTANVGKLKLTSSSVMNIDAAGGQGEITYTFVSEDETRAKAAPEVTAVCVVDWISDIVVNTKDRKITFNVAANDGNERNATIKVEHGTDSFQVMVEQDGSSVADVNFTATHVGGTFYGKFLVNGGQTEGFNYFVILSDTQPEAITSIPAYATEYRFDIYAGETSEFNREVRIPVGTYTIDHSRTSRIGTIDAYQDCSYVYNANGVSSAFKAGTLTVTEDSIVADVTLMNGEVHHVEYNGAPVMEDYSQPTYADVYPVSQYTDTLSFDVTGGYMYAYYRGNWFGGDNDVWFMHMIEHKVGFSGVYMIFNFIVPKSAGGFNPEGYLGEYKLTNPNESMDYTFPAGRLRDDSQQLNAWYMYCINGQIDMSQAAPIVDGTIKVEKIDGNTVITVDGKDDAGNDIKGTFSGVVSELENQGTIIR